MLGPGRVAHQQEAVDEHVLGHRQPGGEQQRRPVDRVELEDVLADEVEGRRPEAVGQVVPVAGEAERGDVVEQRVEPDVEDLVGIPRDRDPPLQPRARERDVLQPLGDERARLVAELAREDEVRVLRRELLELLLEAREAEEPVVLALAVERDLVDRARVVLARLLVGLEVRAAGAVPALVGALVDVAVVVDALEDLLHALLVARVGRADEEVVGGLEPRQQRHEVLDVAVAELLRRDALSFGGERDRLAVLVGAGEEEDLLAALAHVAGQHVGGDRRVRVAEVRRRVHVVDRRGDVEGHRASRG